MQAFMGIDGFWEVKESFYHPTIYTVHCDTAETAEAAIQWYEVETESY